MHKTKQACSLPALQLKLIEFEKKLSSRVCWCMHLSLLMTALCSREYAAVHFLHMPAYFAYLF